MKIIQLNRHICCCNSNIYERTCLFDCVKTIRQLHALILVIALQDVPRVHPNDSAYGRNFHRYNEASKINLRQKFYRCNLYFLLSYPLGKIVS